MKTLKNLTRGQLVLTIPVLIAMGSVLAGSIFWIFGISSASDKADSEINIKITALETIVPEIRDDVVEIKDDIKDIKKALNVK